MGGAPALLIEELTKDYYPGFWRRRPHRALDRLTLRVEHGEVFGFLGPNGAGKTTTLKLLTQLIYPTSGRAEILGHPVGHLPTRARFGFLPENPSFYDYLSAEEILTYFAQLFGYDAAERRRRVAAVLEKVGIGGERRWQLRRFSRGMIQRVGIAQALLNDPEIVFLDEPTSGLDPLGRRDIRSLILELRDQGRTVFFSSHILSDAEMLCSRVAVLARGRLVAQGTVGELTELDVRGWELIVANLSDTLLEHVRHQATRVVALGPGRHLIELPPAPPDSMVRELMAGGASVVSLNPARPTLEDFFVRRVTAADRDEHD